MSASTAERLVPCAAKAGSQLNKSQKRESFRDLFLRGAGTYSEVCSRLLAEESGLRNTLQHRVIKSPVKLDTTSSLPRVQAFMDDAQRNANRPFAFMLS